MKILCLSERCHTVALSRVLLILAALLQGAVLLPGSELGYAFNGTATGFFGGVDVSGWYSADFNSSGITVTENPSYTYTFTGPLNGAGYTQVSQIPPTPCVLLGCVPSGPGNAGLHLAPLGGSVSLNFEDSGEDFLGSAPLVAGWIFNDFQGGSSSAPVSLTSAGPVAEITGSLSAEALQDYYDFQWLSGAFSVTASVADASSGASYLFSVGVAGTCTSGGTATLDSSDSFTSTISIANLAAGEYCIGIETDSSIDPAFALTFNTPVTGSSTPSAVPEPSGFVLAAIGSLLIGLRHLAMRIQAR